MIQRIFFFLIFSCTLSAFNLENMPQNKKVQVRGFLYQTDTQKWYLAEEPNIKSCCIGSTKLKNKQLLLNQEFTQKDLHKAKTLEGILRQKENVFFLEDIVEVHQASIWKITFACILLCTLLIIYKIVIGRTLVRSSSKST